MVTKNIIPDLDVNGNLTTAFQYVEYAIDGIDNRNHVQRTDRLPTFEGRIDAYTSAYLFKEDLKTYAYDRDPHSVKDYNGPAWTPVVHFDVDADDLTVAHDQTRRLVDHLTGLGVPEAAIRVHFSGSKGFHVEVDAAVFGSFAPAVDLPDRVKALATRIAADAGVTVDEAVYDRLRLWREPNSINSKSGLYKIPLRVVELRGLPLAEITELAEKPRQLPLSDVDVEVVPALVEMWEQTATFAAPAAPNRNGRQQAAPLSDRLREGEGRNVEMTSFLGSMRRRGADEDTMFAAARAWSDGHHDPPLPDDELWQIVRSIGGYEPSPDLELTDTGNGNRFARRYGDRVRYVAGMGEWLVWDGRRWVEDQRGQVREYAKDTALSIYNEVRRDMGTEAQKALASWARSSQSMPRINAMLEAASSIPGIVVVADELDADHSLLNVLNGTVDLRTSELRAHRREDLITKLAPVEYDPSAQCPRWRQFLLEIFDGDEELIAYVQRGTGYSIGGSVIEQVLFFLFGGGSNGKSKYIEAISETLGDYWQKAPTEMLMMKQQQGIPNDIARLKGVRLAVAAEVEQGHRFAEAKVKDLTGGDTLTARKLHKEFFDFKPTHKLWMYGNHKPGVRGSDDGIWRRLHLIPFTARFGSKEEVEKDPTIKLKDPNLLDKLRAERAGILVWAVEGHRLWLRDGLGMPKAVKDATREYREEMDSVGEFLSETCDRGPDKSVSANSLYQEYKEWMSRRGEYALGQRTFGMSMTERGFERAKSDGVKVYRGIAIKPFEKPRLLDSATPAPARVRGADPFGSPAPGDQFVPA